MFAFIILTQHSTGSSIHSNQTRKRNERHPSGKEEVKLSFADDKTEGETGARGWDFPGESSGFGVRKGFLPGTASASSPRSRQWAAHWWGQGRGQHPPSVTAGWRRFRLCGRGLHSILPHPDSRYIVICSLYILYIRIHSGIVTNF